ncbi:hypothetical protein QTI24_21785 [Variovorax sp. J22P240]|uniref:hypothetical protein n=1 Tax=Variovorax sp. J22P240 TaxID=3053514 RepID=UPI002577E95C|nr:hypothetical protein [Variovorax sp. J22P240]MDM0001253.1 hypothetical protein [Variovorax sp. J22P240]
MSDKVSTTPTRGDVRPRRKDLAAGLRTQGTSDMEAVVAQVESLREACRIIMRELVREEAARSVPVQERLMMRIFKVASELERKSLQEMVDLIEPQRPLARRVELEQRAIEAVMAGTQWLTAAEIGRLVNPKVVNARSIVNRWQASGRIFGIDHRGEKLYPAYVLDATWRPLPAVKEILAMLTGFSPFRIASWFESTSSALGGRRPRQAIERDPDAVLAAAKSLRAGAIHG